MRESNVGECDVSGVKVRYASMVAWVLWLCTFARRGLDRTVWARAFSGKHGDVPRCLTRLIREPEAASACESRVSCIFAPSLPYLHFHRTLPSHITFYSHITSASSSLTIAAKTTSHRTRLSRSIRSPRANLFPPPPIPTTTADDSSHQLSRAYHRRYAISQPRAGERQSAHVFRLTSVAQPVGQFSFCSQTLVYADIGSEESSRDRVHNDDGLSVHLPAGYCSSNPVNPNKTMP